MSFIDATRQNLQSVHSMKYEERTNTAYTLAHSGFLAKIYLRFKGKVTAKHATKTTFAKAPEAPFNLADRVKFTLNGGTSMWDTSGYGCYLQNMINKNNYAMDYPYTAAAGVGAFKFDNKCSAAGTENDLDFTLQLNIQVNDRDLLGIYLLQTSQTQAILQVDNAAASVLTTDSDVPLTVNGAWYISLEYFDVPSRREDYPSLGNIHKVTEDSQPITSTGQNRFNMTRGNTYLKVINYVKMNGVANSEDVERLKLVYNTTITPYDLDARDMEMIQLTRYGRPLPKGVFVWDFFYSNGLPNLGNQRDFVNTENIADFDQLMTVASGANLGSNNNRIYMISDVLQPVRVTQ